MQIVSRVRADDVDKTAAAANIVGQCQTMAELVRSSGPKSRDVMIPQTCVIVALHHMLPQMNKEDGPHSITSFFVRAEYGKIEGCTSLDPDRNSDVCIVADFQDADSARRRCVCECMSVSVSE